MYTNTNTTMCAIDAGLYEHGGKVREVSSTRILVAPEKGSEDARQVTVYSNRVSLREGTTAVAMSLTPRTFASWTPPTTSA